MMKQHNIQALRAVAAVSVLIFHLGAKSTHDSSLLSFEFGRGIFGVDLFFVLSGFIIAYSTHGKWGHLSRYFTDRALRIYPLYWLCLIIGTPTATVLAWAVTGGPSSDTSFYVQSALLLPVLDQYGQFYPALGVGWTLIYEMFFYLVFGGIMLTSRRHLTIKLAAIFGTALLLGQALPEGAYRTFLTNPIYFEFCIGTLLYEIWQRQWLSISLLAVLAVPAAAMLWMGHPPETWRFAYYGPAAFVMLGIALKLEAAGKSASHSWLLFLGNASYAIYLSHPFTLKWIMDELAPYDLSPVLRSGLMGIGALAFGCALYAVADRPMSWLAKRLLRAFLPPKQANAVLS